MWCPTTAEVRIVIYDVTGRQVRQLLRHLMDAGEHQVTWDSRNDQGVPASSGVYFIRLQGGTNSFETKKLLLVR